MVWKNEQVSEGETGEILRWVRRVLGKDGTEVEGDLVELGCYKGDTSLMLAEVLRDYNRGGVVENSVEKPVKKLWIYDSFEGLPEKSNRDESALGVNFQKGALSVTKREVKERFLRAGLPVPVIKKGWFADLTEADMPERIALAFLDGDLYESVSDSLRLVGAKMAKDGVILVHDYYNPALPGVARAVDEWLKGRGLDLQFRESLVIVTGF